VTKAAIAITAFGPTRHAGEYHKRLFADCTKAEKHSTTTWDNKLQHEIHHGFEISSAEEEFIARYGIGHDHLPCIVFFVAGLDTPLKTISLPATAWSNELGIEQLFRTLKARLNSDAVDAAVSRSGGGDGLRETLEALEGEIELIGVDPHDRISMRVALKDFRVSKPTLLRAIKSGRVRSFRPFRASAKAQHVFSRAQLAANFELAKT